MAKTELLYAKPHYNADGLVQEGDDIIVWTIGGKYKGKVRYPANGGIWGDFEDAQVLLNPDKYSYLPTAGIIRIERIVK